MLIFRTIVLAALLASCSSKSGLYSPNNLSCIQIIDRNQLAETIGTKNRLTAFENTDFMAPQPYEQVLRVFSKDPAGKTPSIITSYHPNGQIYKYLEVLDARACGKYIEWHENGQMKIEAKVIAGPADLSSASQKDWLFDETCHIWDDKGLLIAEIPYEKGVLEGSAIHRHPNGEIAKIVPYEKDQLQGEFSEFTEQGIPLSKIQFSQGVKNGDAITYWENGLLCSIESYDQGYLDNGIYYTKSGKKVAEISNGEGIRAEFNQTQLVKLYDYKNGVPDGLVKCFDAMGRLISSYEIHDGVKSGIEKIYEYKAKDKTETPLLKMSLEWKNDQLHGLVKTWYLNGKKQSQKEIYNNKKNGSFCCWYPDGKVMFVEEYEKDKLIRGTYFKKGILDPVSRVEGGSGIAIIYDENGSLIQKISYEKGEPAQNSN